jgi:hypothetical protein
MARLAAAALHAGVTVRQLLDLDLSYTPPLGSPWDPLQTAAEHWLRRSPPYALGGRSFTQPTQAHRLARPRAGRAMSRRSAAARSGVSTTAARRKAAVWPQLTADGGTTRV